jgi:amino acid adenylation domain-containing protein
MSSVVQHPSDSSTRGTPGKPDSVNDPGVSPGRIPRTDEVGPAPLSFAQQRLWFLGQLEPDASLYNISAAMRVRGSLDLNALEVAFAAVEARHDALRTTFSSLDGEPVQSIGEFHPAKLAVVDLSAVSAERREEEMERRALEEADRPFDLVRGPLFRRVVLRAGPEDHLLVMAMHHIISDGWSMGVLYRELGAFYSTSRAGNSDPLPPLPIQYADFARWQRRWLTGEVLRNQLEYWRRQLGREVPTVDLPCDHRRAGGQTYNGARHAAVFAPELSQALKALSRRERVTLFMTLLAAFQVLIYRMTGQPDVTVGSPIANRNRMEIEGLIGFFVNTLVLRTDLGGNPSFRALLERVRDVALEAYANQDIPFEKIVEELNPDRSSGRTPFFQVMFALQNAPAQPLQLEGLQVTPLPVGSAKAKFDLTVMLMDEAEGLKCSLIYNTDLFDADTIARLARHYQALLAGAAADPDRPIAALPLLTKAELQQILGDWNATAISYPRGVSLQHVFEGQAHKMPETVAVVSGRKRLSYGELNRRSNQLARYLRDKGVQRGSRVGVCLDRSWEWIVALLGVLKAGGTYVPLDTSYPEERLHHMMSDADVHVLLTQASRSDAARRAAADNGASVVTVDRDWPLIGSCSDLNLPDVSGPEDLAYVIYTSGSTGQPKGVGIPHRAVNRLVLNTNYIRIGTTDVVAQLSNPSFDAATFEIWGALLNGARLVLLPKEEALTPRDLEAHIERHGFTILFLTTALFNQVVSERPAVFRNVHDVLFGGEMVDPKWPAEVLRQGPPRRLLHVYGPTETTTFASWHEVSSVTEGATTITIGRPVANTEIYLLDERMEPVPIGVAGELYIGGDGLAHAYVNAPDLTACKFVPNPFGGERGSRLYKTGDLARYLADGSIEIIGRSDCQVKMRGFRIELGEIEVALASNPAVRDAAVVLKECPSGNKFLAAYCVLREGVSDAPDFRGFLKPKLPEYMIPAVFTPLVSMPLTANGKVDRAALPEVGEIRPARNFVEPRDRLELVMARLWERVLNVRSVGATDNFFDLGGHSLLAVTLLAQIDKRFGRQISLATLFHAPTVEALASILRREGLPAQWHHLIPVQPKGSKPPLFCCHGGVTDLARYLGPDQPVYALQPHGYDGRRAPDRVGEMASGYLEEILSVQPEGPHVIAGYSFGGLVALEVAQQLLAVGKPMARLLLIDPTNPALYTARPVRRPVPDRSYGLSLKATSLGELWKQLYGPIRWRLEAFLGWCKAAVCSAYLRSGRRVPEALRQFYFYNACIAAARRYRPETYAGPIVLFCTQRSDDPESHWRPLACGGLEVHDIPGQHLDILQDAHVRILARQLKGCLELMAARAARG